MDEDMAPDEEIRSSNDEDIGNAHIPKMNLGQDWITRTVGKNRASWSDKLDDALWIELEHKAYWALKHENFDLQTTGDHRKVQLNELNELRDQAYENSLIYKEKTKRRHDSKIKDRIFNIGDRVLLFNFRLKIFFGKLKSRWYDPFTISRVYPYGTVELSQPDEPNFKVILRITPKKKSLADRFIFQRRTSTPTGSSGHDESLSLYAELGLMDSEEESDEDVSGTDAGVQGQAGPNPGDAKASQPLPSPMDHAGSHLEHMDLDVADVSTQPHPEQMDEGSSGTLSSLQHLTKDLSFGDLFFNDKPSEADSDKATAETKAGSMVSVMIQQDTSSIPPMTTPIIDLTSRPESPKVHQLIKETTTEITTTTTIHPPPSQPQQSTTDSILMKRIGELEHIMTNLIQDNKQLEQRLDSHGARLYTLEHLDIPHQVSKAVDEVVANTVDWGIHAPLRNCFRDLPEADMKEILHQRMWETNSYKTHEDHMQLYEALVKSMNRDHSKELAKDLAKARQKKKKRRDSPKTPPGSPPHQPPPPPPPAGLSGASGSPGASRSSQVLESPPPPPSTNQEDLQLDNDMAPDVQAQSSDDEDIGNAHIPKVNLQQDWWKPLEEERPATLEPAWSILSSDVLVLKNNWASTLASTYSPPPEDSLLVQTGDIAMFMDCFYQMEECHKLLTDSVDDSILRHNLSKPLPLGGPPGQIKATYYPDVGLEQMVPMVPDQMWIKEECKYDIAAMYGISHWWFQRQRFYIDRHTSEEDFQLGIESYQTQLNLTKPRWDAMGFEYKHNYTVIDSLRAVTFRDRYGVQMIMRFNEIHKFSDGTLQQIDEVAVCSSLRSLKPKCTIESRAKRSSKIISLGHYSIMLASSHTVKMGFNSLVHSFRALSTLRRSGLRTASIAAKPCQGDSLEFYLITDSSYTDQRGTVILATLFNENDESGGSFDLTLSFGDPLFLHPNDTSGTPIISFNLPTYTYDAAKHFDKHNQLIKLMQFLMGLDDVYQPIQSNILVRDPLPPIKTTFAVVSGEESHRNMSNQSKPGASAYASKVFDKSFDDKKKSNNNYKGSNSANRGPNPNLIYTNYNKVGHSVDGCFDIVGYPPNYKKPNGMNSAKFISNNNDVSSNNATSVSRPSSFTLPTLSNEQMKRLMNLLRWIIDSGANQHMTVYAKLLSNIVDIFNLGLTVGHPNGFKGKEDCKDCKQSNELYLFDVYNACKVIANDCITTYHASKSLWHQRLGHPAKQVLLVLKEKLNLDNETISPCDTCHKAKQTKEPFPFIDYKSTKIGELVHLDVWGPYKVSSKEGIEVITQRDDIYLSQRKYCIELLHEFGLLACKPVSIPMEANTVLSFKPSHDNPYLDNITGYQKFVAKLIYLTHTRPDISYYVHCLSQHMHSPLKSHLQSALNVLRYLKGSPGVKGVAPPYRVKGQHPLLGQGAEPLVGVPLPVGNTVKDMTMNFRKLDKFEGHDFRRWQNKMHFLLTTLKVVYVLTTLMLELVEDATVEAIRIRAKWENDDYICMILGQYTQHGLKMDESISVLSIIDKFPPSWKDFKHTLKHVVKRTTQMLVVRERGLRTNPKTKVDAIALWIDSGATTHVCKDHCWFKTFEPFEDGSVLYMGDEHFAFVHGKGSVTLEFSSGKTVTLCNVLYVPKLCKNLVSGHVLNKYGYK
nr:putative ribonuclease H-like domain-containing protein [Tanacetum cinerariifolium]